jgi:NAD(P)H-dependent FMN reductase
MMNLKVIIGSTRAGRAADLVAPWIIGRAKLHDAFDVDVLDLRDWPLPMFAETIQTIGDFANPTYSEPIVKQWNLRIKQGDAFLFITPEYNHSVPGVLKNAIDNVFASFAFRNKPAAFVGYSAGRAAGVRAIEHLADVVLEAEMVPLRNSVLIPEVHAAFEGAKPRDPIASVSLAILLDDLAWWGNMLCQARANGELPPGGVRLRAALEPVDA